MQRIAEARADIRRKRGLERDRFERLVLCALLVDRLGRGAGVLARELREAVDPPVAAQHAVRFTHDVVRRRLRRKQQRAAHEIGERIADDRFRCGLMEPLEGHIDRIGVRIRDLVVVVAMQQP